MTGQIINVTLDSKLSWNINSPHPAITALRELENEGRVSIHTADRSAERLDNIDKRTYEMFLKVTHWGRGARTLDDHTDLCLLSDHLDSRRDYFVTLNEGNILRRKDKLEKLGVKVRPPTKEFIEEIKNRADEEFPSEILG